MSLTYTSVIAGILDDIKRPLSFTIFNVGARPVAAAADPFSFDYLPDFFPDSRIIAFEVDPGLCEKLNRNEEDNAEYFAVALGRTEEERPFYNTQHPMCSSLYKPNEALIKRYNNLHVASLHYVGSMKTVSMDHFVSEHDVGPVDLIKIDVQGAELDIFSGGLQTIKDVVAIVSEVEFVMQYEGQPLFGDVSEYLAEQGLSYHKLLTVGTRSLAPIVINNDPNVGSQHIWSDAMFVRDLGRIAEMSADQLLKLAVIANVCNSLDITLYCLMEFDRREGTSITRRFIDEANIGPYTATIKAPA